MLQHKTIKEQIGNIAWPQIDQCFLFCDFLLNVLNWCTSFKKFNIDQWRYNYKKGTTLKSKTFG